MSGLATLGWIDWALMALLLLSVVVGLWRGLVYEVMSLLGWVMAYVLAQWHGPTIAPWLPVGAPGSALNAAAAFVAVFLAVLVAWSLLAWLLRRLIQASPLDALNRVLGAAFGLLRGLLVGLAVATAVNLTPLAESPSWRASHGAAGLGLILSELRPLLPPDVARHLRA